MFNNGQFTEAEGMFTRKDLMKLLAPLIVEQILAVLVGMVDVMMVAAVCLLYTSWRKQKIHLQSGL